MGYTTRFTGELEFDRDLYLREYKDLVRMNEDPDYCKNFTSTPETIPNSYLQWVPNEDGTALAWDGGEKFYDYIHWLRWLIKHYMKPHDITLNGSIRWQGEELDDGGVITVIDNKVTFQKIVVDGIVECPNCGEKFKPDEE